ncbi:MAG: hypothetical protein GF311_01965, partial [Candidatus Lokiarchaeota archaeon]|nr:hypothetical protein [Candidatus Lokiarchaeota archaeon]
TLPYLARFASCGSTTWKTTPRNLRNKSYCRHRGYLFFRTTGRNNNGGDKMGNIQLDFPSPELRDCRMLANELLMDVFENILFNSIKHNENYQIDIMIKISQRQTNDTNCLFIQFIDNGRGITDSLKKHVFQRAADQSIKGMGLGLTLVNKIIESFNGDIWVEDRIKGDYSKGSIFHLCLPLISQ